MTEIEETGSPTDGVDGTVNETVTYREGERTPAPSAVGPLTRGATLGRYVVLEAIGSGGMGAVYAAYDPELDRKVAVKVLHPRHHQSTRDRTQLRQRLAREAQALAKLNHPNVLTVFDVGAVGSRLFLATELVDGVTLRDWLAEARPSMRSILARFGQAGEGLWAAHESGLVHRDFKPANVMTSDDGRVLVLDFGLARADGMGPVGEGPVVPLDEASPTADVLAGDMTHTGVAMGTPAYMAPEQHRGDGVGPASDQFSFCVSLWWALTGASPFGDTDGAIGVSRLARGWDVVDSAVLRRMPTHVRLALQRGLAPRPEDRFATMRTLLDALAADPWRRRRRVVLGIVATVGVGLAAFGVQQAVDHRRQLCGGARSKLVGVWDATRRGVLERVFAASDKPFAADAWRETQRLLDDYSDAWATTHAETCAATQIRGEQSPELLDRRMACLDQRRRELGALASLLGQGGDQLVEASVSAASLLTPLEVCADTVGLLATSKPPADDETRQRVDAIRVRLASAKARADAGDYGGALARATPLVEEAEAIGYWPLTAESLLLLGRIQELRFEAVAAQATLERAGHAAQAGGNERVGAEVFTRLTRVTGFQQSDYSTGFHWGRLADAAVGRLDQATGIRADLEDILGALHGQQGRYEVALVHHERALALKREIFGPQHIGVASSLARIGNVFFYQHRGEQALAYYREALANERRALGPSHPRVASAIARVGGAYAVMGEHETALAEHEQALALRRDALAPDHVQIGNSLFSIGNALLGLRRYDEALDHYERALALFQQQLKPRHRDVAAVLSNMALTWLEQDNHAQARDAYRRVLAIRQEIYEPDHQWIAETLGNLGALERDVGAFDAARAYYAEALAIVEEKVGSEHFIAGMHAGLGGSLVASGAPAAGFEHLEKALALRRQLPNDAERESDILMDRARAFVAPGWPGHDPAKGCREAWGAYEELVDSERADKRTTIEAWLGAQSCSPGAG